MADKMEDVFWQAHVSNMQHYFWVEEYKQILCSQIELRYHTDIIRWWAVVDIIPNGDKFLIKWAKRLIPLTDEQLEENYGRGPFAKKNEATEANG